ncbi:MAG TPA: diacylglycerol kinase family protein [Burkholderiales bacterium]|jgi:diacylglycerol kinase family enzyme|nr:diacylglycerol kinase family protein [Burkholderiales bacterium]
MPGTLPVLVNGASGGGHGDGLAANIEGHFREAGAHARVALAHDGNSLLRLAAEALGAKPKCVIVAGGDGTVSAVASVLAGSGIPLAVLPLGTLNHFARDLGIPDDLAQAVRVAVEGNVRAVDVGEVNGRVFINNSSIGLYPSMVRRREKQRRRLGRSKWHAMLWAALNALRAHPFLHLRLEVGEAEHRRRTPLVFIGNNVYRMEGFDIGVRERLDQGVLSLYLARRGRGGLVLLALRALLGRLDRGDDFEAGTVRRLRIDSRRHKRLLVARDGEIEPMELPLDYRIRPGALRVVAP